MSGRALLRRAAASIAALAAFCAAASCSVAVDLEPLGDHRCPSGQKACYVVDEGDMGCVSVGDPEYGCTAEGCAPCSLQNAAAVCAPSDPAGKCVMSACVRGFEDCDGNLFNGCETNTETDVDHCAVCGNGCSCDDDRIPICMSGACRCR